MRRTTLLFIAAFLAAGCQAPLRPYRSAPNPVVIDAREYDRIFAAAVEVLRDQGFQVDRQDYRFGVITTHPLHSPTIGEPWRPQNTTLGQTLESTLDHVRRRVEVTFEPAAGTDAAEGPAEAYQLAVEVVTENHAVPTRRLTMAAEGRRYSNLAGVPYEWRERGIPGSYWVATGRDPHLEQRLIRAIVERSLRIAEPLAAR